MHKKLSVATMQNVEKPLKSTPNSFSVVEMIQMVSQISTVHETLPNALPNCYLMSLKTSATDDDNVRRVDCAVEAVGVNVPHHEEEALVEVAADTAADSVVGAGELDGKLAHCNAVVV